MKPTKKQPRAYAEYPVTDFQKRGAELLNEVQYGLQPIIITRHDKPVAFLAPMALLEKLDAALIEVLEAEGTRIETMTREIRRTAARAEEASEPKTVTGRAIRKPAR